MHKSEKKIRYMYWGMHLQKYFTDRVTWPNRFGEAWLRVWNLLGFVSGSSEFPVQTLTHWQKQVHRPVLIKTQQLTQAKAESDLKKICILLCNLSFNFVFIKRSSPNYAYVRLTVKTGIQPGIWVLILALPLTKTSLSLIFLVVKWGR